MCFLFIITFTMQLKVDRKKGHCFIKFLYMKERKGYEIWRKFEIS